MKELQAMIPLKDLSFSENLDIGIFPDRTIASLPVLKFKDNRLFQLHFLFCEGAVDDIKIDRPFAWVIVPVDNIKEISVIWCSALDFIEALLQNDKVSLYNRQMENLENDRILLYKKELKELFYELTEFAFREDIGDIQTAMMARFSELFLLLTPPDFYHYYNSLSPDFFEWLGLNIGGIPEEVICEQEAVLGEIKKLSRELREQFFYDKQKEKLFDQLHDELQRYKTGAYEEILLSSFRDVIVIIDSIQNILKQFSDREISTEDTKKMLELFRGVGQDLEDLLYRQGVDPYISDNEDVEIPYQKVLATETTQDKEKDKKISERLTKGWKKGSNILRPEYVRVYLYEEPDLLQQIQDTKELSTNE